MGGAHLKVALVDGAKPFDVRQIVCPLWQGLDRLDAALAEAAPLVARADRVAITMTGELSDLFPDRATGVQTLVARLDREFGGKASYWMGPRGFGAAAAAVTSPADTGSTNFLATAGLIGARLSEALLIDFGTTTADVVPIRDGAPCPHGLTDASRQASGELVYTGFTRTAVMGVAQEGVFRGERVSLAREYLATMADVRRALGVDLSEIDLHATADGKGRSLDESLVRLARMLGRDLSDGTRDEFIDTARGIREAQLRSIHDGAALVLSRATLPAGAPVVAAGVGASDVAVVAERLGRRSVVFSDLANAEPACRFWATACAPAVSVALLLSAGSSPR